jgi:hypothetical protein
VRATIDVFLAENTIRESHELTGTELRSPDMRGARW